MNIEYTRKERGETRGKSVYKRCRGKYDITDMHVGTLGSEFSVT